MQISGYDPIIDTTDQTGTVVSVPHADSKRVNAYGYDLMLLTAFYSVSPIVIAAAGWDDTTDVITSASHGLKTGMVLQVATSGTLPAGITALTDYYVIALTDDTFSLATSLADAVAGTAVDFTDAGVGNHTVTQQTDVATYKVQVSPDGSEWFDYNAVAGVSVVGNANAHIHFESASPFVRVQLAITKGHASTIKAWLLGKG